jgi:hypothetical protein
MELVEATALRDVLAEIEALLGRIEPTLRRVVSIGYQAEGTVSALRRVDGLLDAIEHRQRTMPGLSGWSAGPPPE